MTIDLTIINVNILVHHNGFSDPNYVDINNNKVYKIPV